MRINNNLMAMNTHRQLGASQTMGARSMEKLSSGFRINRAGDDAAGLSISEKMRGQIRGLNQASRNAQDGISMIQTAEGALNETHAILQRMRELAVQSSTDTNTAADRAEIQKEVDELSKEITRISETTEFNTKNLLDGTLEAKFHIGANEGQDVDLSIKQMDAEALSVKGTAYTDTDVVGNTNITVTSTTGDALSIVIQAGPATAASELGSVMNTAGTQITITLESAATNATSLTTQAQLLAELESIEGITVTTKDAFDGTALAAAGTTTVSTVEDTTKEVGINVSSQTDASAAITTINNAIESVSAERSKLGAMQNRLEHTIKNLDTSSENLQASESRIRDVDMAKEMMEFTKQNILQQASTAMLAQANQAPQSVLQLLG